MERSFWDVYGTYSGAGITHQEQGTDTSMPSVFDLFEVSASEVPDSLPDDLIPCRHQMPDLTDPSVHFPDLTSVFTTSPKLTDVKEGIQRQKVNRNLVEIAEAICQLYQLLTISGRLAVCRKSHWYLMEEDEAMHFVVKNTRKLFNSNAKYLSTTQFEEVLSQMIYHDQTKHLKNIPTPDYRYLACRDKLYDWHTGKCLSHNSSDYRFTVLNINAEDIGNSDGQHWELFLDNLTGGDEALRQRVLEVIGVILSGYPSKSFFLLTGESGTRKTQLANFLRNVLGTDACFALNDISQLGDKWTTGSIFGKLLCLCGDMPDTPLSTKAIGTIKQLTGDDLIRGEFKYKDAFAFENTSKLLFVSNYPLQIPNSEQEDALLKRLVAIPCLNPVPDGKHIEKLHIHLHKEAGYIIRLAMDALIDLEARNGVFTPLPDWLEFEAVQVPDSEQVLHDFISECCQLDRNASCKVEALFQAFKAYAPASEIDTTQFSKRICRLYPEIARSRTSKARGYQGIQLKSENPV